MEKRLFFIIIIALIIILIVATSFWLVFLPAEPLIKKEVIFSVEKGGGLKEIAFNLEKENLIRWAPAFMAYVLVKGIAGGLKSGEYILSPSMNIPQIADKLFRGDVIKERITIIEGWSLRDIGFYFENKGMFRVPERHSEGAEMKANPEGGKLHRLEEVWQMAMKDFSNDFDFLKDKPENLGLEGYLFPDTYEIRKNEGLENIIKRMLNNFGRRLTPDLREEIKRQNRTIFEIVTMASMIEREVRKKEDKKLVSGILWKRLKIGMPLQVDATIAYILGRENWTFDEMRREIALGRDIDSPYNTYKYRGLPLGPISNPGLESIIASVYPKSSQYWYYLSTPEGETIFSKTLEEHNIAKAKYLK